MCLILEGLSDELLLDIAKEISGDWRDLGIYLNLRNSDLDNIDSDKRTVSEKAFASLIKWNY